MGALDGISEAIVDLNREIAELEARLVDVETVRDQLMSIAEVLGNPVRIVVPLADDEPAKPRRERPERRTGNRPGPVSDKPDYPVIAEFVLGLLDVNGRAAVGPAIAERFQVPLSTAKNWMNRCRKLGLLELDLTPGPPPKEEPKATPSSPRRQRKYDLDKVAELANTAIEMGVSMRGFIAHHFDITDVHAGILIGDARRAGNGIARQSPGRKNPLPAVNGQPVAPRRSADQILGPAPTPKVAPEPMDYGNIPDAEQFVADYLDCIRANQKPIDTLAARYLCDRQAVQQAIKSARSSQLLPPSDQPQLPAEERRSILDAYKPEPVP